MWDRPLRYSISLALASQASGAGICLCTTLQAWTGSTNGPLRLPSCVPLRSYRLTGGIGISTDCPSPTLLSLGLGPDLPWADEPSPGTLRLPAGRILTCLLAYLYRHSRFCTLQPPFRLTFSAYRTLPYHPGGRKPDVRCRIFWSSS